MKSSSDTLQREKEPRVACPKCGWKTSESHAADNKGMCGYCSDLTTATLDQKKRIERFRNTPIAEQREAAKALCDEEPKEKGRLFCRGFVCAVCSGVFCVTFTKDDSGRVVSAQSHTSTQVCPGCTTATALVLQWKIRKTWRACEACTGSGKIRPEPRKKGEKRKKRPPGAKKTGEPCATCRGTGRLKT